MSEKQEFGLIGLAVMGQNLVLNVERNGYSVAVYNRTTSKTEEFAAGPAKGKNIKPTETIEAFVASLEQPRRIMIMVQAGPPVDAVIGQLRPLLDQGDLVIDGGNSWYQDTERRMKSLEADGIGFLGVGVSGGEEGALWGPSLMPGGTKDAYEKVEPILKKIAAKAKEDGEPCVAYLGRGGAGHYVKMVHNGIEYGDMQLIAESYDILRRIGRLEAPQLADIFDEWNRGELLSFLIEITADIFRKIDDATGKPLVEMVLDSAGQKGTGRWTAQDAMEIGAPFPTVSAAVAARIISAHKPARIAAEKIIPGPQDVQFTGDVKGLIDDVRAALYASKICSYAQGMAMLKTASDAYGWSLPLGTAAKIWRAGCIIRAALLGDITRAFEAANPPANLLLDDFFKEAVISRQNSWRRVVGLATRHGIPVPAMSASLAYFDSYRTGTLPANLIQAQRDYFGAHTYQRIDKEGIFHSHWGK
ncbi:MAG: NADP-dependent phosphogluconate dehydrogenase [Anaerolineae bacterium]|nr:NADP-dependent phosphogluconate dehydrogenase [Anaerolineae bacterium]